MSLSIFEYGDGRFRLFHGDREIGWVEGRAVGFVGFASDDEAVRAATIAYDALSGWLARQAGGTAIPRRGRRLRVRAEGGERTLTLGNVPVGRLVSGPGEHATDSTSPGFELLLPPRVGAALTAAHIVDLALAPHRVGAAAEATVSQPVEVAP